MISSRVNSLETAKVKDWYVLYTRSRCEKKVARELTCAQVETFLPMNSVIKTWSDRKKLIK
ncbi:MAG: transcription termination/antitermination NusG family protein, partial [bacterium]